MYDKTYGTLVETSIDVDTSRYFNFKETTLSPLRPPSDNTSYCYIGPGRPTRLRLVEYYDEQLPKPFNSSPITVVTRSEESWKDPVLDRDSFAKLKREGLIKMSRYRIGNIETEYPVVELARDERIYNVGFRPLTNAWNTASWLDGTGRTFPADRAQGTNTFTYRACRDASWSEIVTENVPQDFLERKPQYTVTTVTRTHYSRFGGPVLDLTVEPDCSHEINLLRSRVVSATISAYDAATELFEMKSTLNTAKSLLKKGTFSLQSAKNSFKSFKNFTNTVTGNWLQGRYGILPVMYSLNDIREELEKKNERFQTQRASSTVRLTSRNVPKDYEGLYLQGEGTYKFRAMSKSKFTSAVDRLASRTSFNFLVATWETVKYSLIVDWFINFGEWLQANTSFVASNSQFCDAIKKNAVYELHYRFKKNDGSYGDVVLMRRFEDTYTRDLFSPTDVELSFRNRFTSDYRKWMDAFSMGLQPLTKALRRLK